MGGSHGNALCLTSPYPCGTIGPAYRTVHRRHSGETDTGSIARILHRRITDRLIPQRFPRHQHVLNPRVGFFAAAEVEEDFAFKIEDILFAR